MKKISFYFLLMFIVLLANSCATTSTFMIDVRHPAYVKFPENIVSLAIVDNAGGRMTDSITQTPNPEQELLLSSMAKDVLSQSLSQFLNEEKYFNEVKTYPVLQRSDEDYDKMHPLTPSQIQKISKEADADAIVSLDLVRMKAGNTTKDLDGMGVRVKYAKMTILFRIYDAEGVALAPAMMSQDSTLWISDSQDEMDISVYRNLALTMSEGMVRQIVPYWEKQERVMYTDGTNLMKEAKKLATANNWAEAAKVWGAAFEREGLHDDYKARIASNIALANESLLDFTNAVTWINIASSFSGKSKYGETNEYVTWYKAKLMEREQGKQKLMEQLSSNEPSEPIDEVAEDEISESNE